jgi:hypothetical protein
MIAALSLETLQVLEAVLEDESNLRLCGEKIEKINDLTMLDLVQNGDFMHHRVQGCASTLATVCK